MKCLQALPLRDGTLSVMMKRVIDVATEKIDWTEPQVTAYFSFTVIDEKEKQLFEENKIYTITIKPE